MLKGMWLKEAFFDVGDYISVTYEDGKIVIAQDAERAAVKAAETEFMDRKMVGFPYSVNATNEYHINPP